MELNKSTLSPMQRGKLDKALAVQYRFFSGEIMTMGEYVARNDFDRKLHSVEYYARHKRQGEYKQLTNPRHVYSLFLGDRGVDVPKMLYDLVELPEVVTDYGPRGCM